MTAREFAIALAILAVALLGVFLIWRAKPFSGWQRKAVQAAGIFLFLFAVGESLNWARKPGMRMPAPVFTTESPDGRFIAKIVEPDGDLIPTRMVRISVRRSGHFFAEEVYVGEQEPSIRWIDNETLQLSYPKRTDVPFCGSNSPGAKIRCNAVSPETFKPELRE